MLVPLATSLPTTCSSTASTSPPAMAMCRDPAFESLDPEADSQTSSLTDIMTAMTTKDLGSSATNGVGNGGTQKEVPQDKRSLPLRQHLTGRKLSLQERGTNLSLGSGRGYTQVSPCMVRRPTVESKHISISDSQVRNSLPFHLF